MKFLVLILTFSCVAMGQNTETTPESWRWQGDNLMLADTPTAFTFGLGKPIMIDTTPSDIDYYRILKPILLYYDRYAKECYADSTRMLWPEVIDLFDTTSRQFEFYDHRRPTFEGFIEWLKKQH